MKELLPIGKTAGGRYIQAKKNIYFIASNVKNLGSGVPCYDNLLIPMNEIKGDSNVAKVKKWMDDGNTVFIDSGIFMLVMDHARLHDISMNEALAMAPDKVDGFDALYERYIELCRYFEDHCWGYLELDQGGRENKRITRAKLEALGLRPIPVYHPLNDGWDYFDELASTYDRIGVGNVVQADRNTRKRILATMVERMQDYPKLWIHLLGLTPNEWMYALPASSADSSSWLAPLRWAGHITKSMGKAFSIMHKNYSYKLGSDKLGADGEAKAYLMGALGARAVQMNWEKHIAEMEKLQLWTTA